MKSRLPSPTLERLALGLGLASSACLAVAAFAAFADSKSAAWSHLDDLATRGRANVLEAWSAITRVDTTRGLEATCVGSASEIFVFDTAPQDALPSPPEPLRPGPLLAPSLFEALLDESGRAELVKQDLPEALALATEAAQKDAPPEHVAQARLRAIQLAARQGSTEIAHAQWDTARNSIDPGIVSGETSTLLLCGLAALPTYAEAERVAAVEPIVAQWIANGLVLPGLCGFESADDDPGTRFAWSASPRATALRERLLESCARPAVWTASFARYDDAVKRKAFLEWIGVPLPADARRDAWSLHPAAVGLLALRADDDGRRIVQIVRREFVEKALQDELAARHALPEGFWLDVRDSVERGDMVGSWIDLGPAFPRVALRHPDVPSILREVEARWLWTRGGLLVLALFVAGAGVATFHALRRERRLAQARTAFVANVSHELRTPLASILLMAENLESGRAGDNASRYHGLLKREATRLRRLVDDVLDFSRLERGQRFAARVDDVEFAPWFEALSADAVELGAPTSIAVRCSSSGTPSHASFDREALRRAVLNLVDNALRHSGSAEVELRARAREHELVLTVADRGKGIPRAQRTAVFEPFTRLDASSATPGTGLGLAIVREIAEAHGGSVVVRERNSGPGAEFELVVPLANRGESLP